MQQRALIDGFSFTYASGYDYKDRSTEIATIKSYVEFLLGSKLPNPDRCSNALHYRKRYSFYSDSGRKLADVNMIPTSPKAKDACTVSLTGYACSNAADSLQLDPVGVITRVTQEAGGHLSKIDLALDVFGNTELMSHVLAASDVDSHQDNIISPLRYAAPMTVNRQTVYYGKRESGKNSVCIYNKQAQLDTDYSWTRLEFRAGARKLLDSIAYDLIARRSVSDLTCSLLNTYLHFKEPGRQSLYRRPTATWWTDLIGDAQQYEYARHDGPKADDDDRKRPKSIVSMAQVLKTLDAFLAGADGQDAFTKEALIREINYRLAA